MKMPIAILIIFIVGLLSGCASVNQPMDSSKYFRRDIQILFAGKTFEGTAVLPSQSSYDIVLKPKADMDFLLIKSCHREMVAEKASGGGLFSKNEYKYAYTPVPKIEGVGVCPVRIDALESGSNQFSGAFIDFERDEFKLPFFVACNGASVFANGVAVCQARMGTTQVVAFDFPVRFAPPMPATCSAPQFRGGRYEIDVSRGECSYMFDAQDKRAGRLTTLGYEGIVIRKAN